MGIPDIILFMSSLFITTIKGIILSLISLSWDICAGVALEYWAFTILSVLAISSGVIFIVSAKAF